MLVTQTYHDYPCNLYEEEKVIILGGEGTNLIRAKVFELSSLEKVGVFLNMRTISKIVRAFSRSRKSVCNSKRVKLIYRKII